MVQRIRNTFKIAVISALSLISMQANAQEMLGIMNSNYAGVTSVTLNPSNMAFSRLKWDLNLIGADIFINNNYVYYPNNAITSGELFNGGAKLSDYYTPNPSKEAYLNIFLKLPSLMVNVSERHTFAISTHVRTNLSIENLSYDLAKFAYDDQHLHFTPLQNKTLQSGPFYMAAMSWSELALSYSYILKKSYRGSWAVGATLKPMFGLAIIPLTGGEAFSAAYINGNDIKYKVTETPGANNTTQVNFLLSNLDWEYGHALNSGGVINGSGMGVDVGITYVRKKGVGGFVPYFKRINGVQPYKYKIGVSLIDFGHVAYTVNSKALQLKQGAVNWNQIDTTKFRSFNNFDESASSAVYPGNIVASKAADGFSMGLPMATSVQFDCNINDRFYVGSIWINPLVYQRPSIVRPAQLSFIPRYETKYFEVSMPLSLYNYSDMWFGLAFRMGPLIVGTDRLSSYIGLNDVTGLDIYFAIKVMVFKENISSYNPLACFYKRIFHKFQRKAPPPKIPVSMRKK